MTIILFVGDITSEVCDSAIARDPGSQLITTQNLNQLDSGTYYTSLADCGSLQNFNRVCQLAEEIFYIEPAKWSDADKNNNSKQQEWTKFVLAYFQQFKPVHNLPSAIAPDWLQGKRVADKQFWVAGCSVSAGLGVSKEESWPELVSKELNLPYTNLSYLGSSIIWQSDQICRSDIRCGEIVFWGVTSPNRMPIMTPEHRIMHFNTSVLVSNTYAINNLSPDLLSNDTLTYHNVLAVRRAYNYCQKIGAYLVPIGVCYDLDNVYTQYNIPPYQQLSQWCVNEYADLGSDQSHPGPIQHKLFAEKFLSQYKKVYS